jgi:hypothetical protein
MKPIKTLVGSTRIVVIHDVDYNLEGKKNTHRKTSDQKKVREKNRCQPDFETDAKDHEEAAQ